MLALRVLCRRGRPDQPRHRPGGPGHRSRPGLGTGRAAQRNLAQVRRAGDQFVARRPPDPAGDAGRGQGVPHPAAADRRPAGRPGTHQRTPQRPRRGPAPRQPGRGRGRFARRRGQYQPGREPGLRAGPEPEELGHPGRPRPLPGRRRRLPRRHSRLHAGRRGPERHPPGLQPAEALADEAFVRAFTCCRGPCSWKTAP